MGMPVSAKTIRARTASPRGTEMLVPSSETMALKPAFASVASIELAEVIDRFE